MKRDPFENKPDLVVIRDQAAYEAFQKTVYKWVASPIPPAVPSKDPILKKPEIDFTKMMLLVVRRYDSRYAPDIKSITLRPGKSLVVKAHYEASKSSFGMADKWSYVAVTTRKVTEPVELIK